MMSRYSVDIVTLRAEDDTMVSLLDAIAAVHGGTLIIDSSFAFTRTPRYHRKYFNMADSDHSLGQKVRSLESLFPGSCFTLKESFLS